MLAITRTPPLLSPLVATVLLVSAGVVALPGSALAGPEGLKRVEAKEAVESIRKRAEANPALPKGRRPQARKADNIGHEILNGEIPLGTVRPEMYKLVDEVIEAVKARVGPRPNGDAKAMRVYAQDTLKLIDTVLISKNFVYPPEDELTLSLSKALTPTKLDEALLSRLLQEPANTRRTRHIQDNSTNWPSRNWGSQPFAVGHTLSA